jgi:hypothetical protein
LVEYRRRKSMKFILVFTVLFFQNAFANDSEETKSLKLGEVYSFVGHFIGNKILDATVVCTDPKSSTPANAGADCGHTKHCTYMKNGESGQTAHIKFKCGQ